MSSAKSGSQISKIIDEQEIDAFLAKNSSFAFEMQVAREFRNLGFEIQHSGNYADPNTRETRQFDIRAMMVRKRQNLILSVECKHLSEDHPLVVSCTPRAKGENYHCLFHGAEPGTHAIKLRTSSIYNLGVPVGRAIEQFSADDRKVKPRYDYYSKFSQAVQSSISMLANVREAVVQSGVSSSALIIPCLVVPDDQLWITVYDEKSRQVGKPSREEHASIFIGLASNYQPSAKHEVYQYSFSHLEVMTFKGIKTFFEEHLRARHDWDHLFED